MPKYLVSWVKRGVAEIDAADHDAALAEFATWGDDEVLATTDDDDYWAETPKERADAQRRNRHGDNLARLDRQDTAEEQRHG